MRHDADIVVFEDEGIVMFEKVLESGEPRAPRTPLPIVPEQAVFRPGRLPERTHPITSGRRFSKRVSPS